MILVFPDGNLPDPILGVMYLPERTISSFSVTKTQKAPREAAGGLHLGKPRALQYNNLSKGIGWGWMEVVFATGLSQGSVACCVRSDSLIGVGTGSATDSPTEKGNVGWGGRARGSERVLVTTGRGLGSPAGNP